MKKRIQFLLWGLLVGCSLHVFGYSFTMYPYTVPAGKQGDALGCVKAEPGMKLELGKWYTNWSVCKAYADQNNVPLLAVWSNETCVHCWWTDRVFKEPRFQEWQATNSAGRVIYCFMAGELNPKAGALDQVNSPGYNWAYKNPKGGYLAAYPFVALYWKGHVDERITGDDICKGTRSAPFGFSADTLPQRVENVIAYLEKTFKNWVPPLDYVGGFFKHAGSNDVAQVESTTPRVLVSLVREGADLPAFTQTLKISVPGKNLPLAQAQRTVSWEANQTNQVVELTSFNSTYYRTGAQITLSLLDPETNEVRSKMFVDCVNAQAPSVKNPLWLGERTVETLQPGEWTMDLALAEEATATNGGWTLVLQTGALWCPWCRGLEDYVLSTPMFTAWTQSNRVNLVCLENVKRVSDLDSYGPEANPKSVSAEACGAGPSLLCEEAGLVNNQNVSGYTYLTRKAIAPEEARTILQRNHDLGYIGGRFAPPDSYRSGYPSVLLLDAQGEIVGRLNYQADIEKDAQGRHPFNFQENFARFVKLIEQASVTNTANQFVNTTTRTLSIGLDEEALLTVSSPKCVFELLHVPAGEVTFQTDVAFTNRTVTLKKLVEQTLERKDATGGVVRTERIWMPETIASVTNQLNHIFQTSDQSERYFIEVVANLNATEMAQVTLSSSLVLAPSQVRATYTPVGSSVAMDVVANHVYRLTGGWGNLAEAFETNSEGDYVARTTGRVILSVTPNTEVTYQEWKPGTVGFVSPGARVKENAQAVQVPLARTDGVSGAVCVRVAVNTNETTLVAQGMTRYTFTPAEFTWAEGENFETNVVISIMDDVRYDGDGVVVLDLELISSDGAVLGTQSYTLNVQEDDEAAPGAVAFTEATPFFSKKQTVYTKASQEAYVTVSRVKASDGEVSVKVTPSVKSVHVSGLTNGQLTWGNHDAQPKLLCVTGVEVGRSARLTLSGPTGGLKVLSVSNTVTVVAVADQAPEFETPTASESLYRYMVFSNAYALAQVPIQKISFSKLSGTLPAGLKAFYDAQAQALVLSGTVTAPAGVYTCVYQVKDGTLAGLTKELTLTVIDPTAAKASPATANESMGETRTYRDVPMIDPVTKRLMGVLQLTLPPKGNVSAKYQCAEGTISFATKSWQAFNPTTKELGATLTASRRSETLAVAVANDGTVTAVLTDAQGSDWVAEIDPHSLWSRTNPATSWQGYYTVSLPVAEVTNEVTSSSAPRGSAYLTLKMNTTSALNSGKVTWAGVLPNGVGLSGSTVLTACGDWAKLPLFKKSTTDLFAGLLDMKARAVEQGEARAVRASEEAQTWWHHAERIASTEGSWDVRFQVWGGPYNAKESLAACCQESYETTSPLLHFDVTQLDTTAQGVVRAPEDVRVTVAEAKLTLPTTKPAGLTLSVNRTTGIVTGSVRLPIEGSTKYITANVKGVILQGWGPGCAACGPGSADLVYRPFISGFYSFTDRMLYQDGARTLSVKRGGAMDVQGE